MARIYTDGGFSIPRNIGAWALAVVEGNVKIHEERGEVTNSTSNRCELMAFKRALELITEYDITQIISDSQYVVRGYNSWMRNWQYNDWKRGEDDLKNADLWKSIWDLKNNSVSVKWIKGHDGNKWNEYVDTLTKV